MTGDSEGAGADGFGGGRHGGLVRAIRLWVAVPQWLRMLVPVLAMAMLWRLSSREPSLQPESTAHVLLHNSMHVVAYGCLAASLWLAFAREPIAAVHALRSRGAWLVASLYGVVDELHQSYVPGRVCSLADLASDAIGAALGVVLLRRITGMAPNAGLVTAVLLLAAIASISVATFAGW